MSSATSNKILIQNTSDFVVVVVVVVVLVVVVVNGHISNLKVETCSKNGLSCIQVEETQLKCVRMSCKHIPNNFRRFQAKIHPFCAKIRIFWSKIRVLVENSPFFMFSTKKSEFLTEKSGQMMKKR